jgi:hypothetical protein
VSRAANSIARSGTAGGGDSLQWLQTARRAAHRRSRQGRFETRFVISRSLDAGSVTAIRYWLKRDPCDHLARAPARVGGGGGALREFTGAQRLLWGSGFSVHVRARVVQKCLSE